MIEPQGTCAVSGSVGGEFCARYPVTARWRWMSVWQCRW